MDDLAGLLHHHHTPLTALALHDSHLTTQLATPVHVVYGVMSSFHDGFFFLLSGLFFGTRSVDLSRHSQIDKKIPQNDTRALFFITDLGDGKGLREVYGQWFFFTATTITIFPDWRNFVFLSTNYHALCFPSERQPGRTKLKDSQAGHAPPSLP